MIQALVEELKGNLDTFCQLQLDNLYKDYILREKLSLEDGKRPHDSAKHKFQKYMNIEGKIQAQKYRNSSTLDNEIILYAHENTCMPILLYVNKRLIGSKRPQFYEFSYL